MGPASVLQSNDVECHKTYSLTRSVHPVTLAEGVRATRQVATPVGTGPSRFRNFYFRGYLQTIASTISSTMRRQVAYCPSKRQNVNLNYWNSAVCLRKCGEEFF